LLASWVKLTVELTQELNLQGDHPAKIELVDYVRDAKYPTSIATCAPRLQL
jgi:hypothetical protein